MIYIVRHGETDWNKEMRLQGREDIPLNEEGISQAKKCGEFFKDKKIGLIATSPLERAEKTGKIICELIGDPPILIDDELIERDFGLLSGKPYDRKTSYRPAEEELNMEPMDVLAERMKQAVLKYGNGENVILVSHGASINALLGVLSNGELGPGKTWLKNACISGIKIENTETTIVFSNKTVEELEKLIEEKILQLPV